MTAQHPITPPPELVQQWRDEWENYTTTGSNRLEYVATQAACWGADRELEACCDWLLKSAPWTVEPSERPSWIDVLLRVRRPKRPSLKEQALNQLILLQTELKPHKLGTNFDTIRDALEALPDD